MEDQNLNTENTHGKIQITEGSLWKNIFLFSFPLMLSQLLQVLFNMADVAVVGKFSSAEALGAVWFHFKGSVKGMIIGIVFAPIVGLIVMLMNKLIG